jgi:predicted nuclease of predicted toxin-antitoxin system
MRLFIDESLSPRLARHLNETGLHDATHSLLGGGRSEPDHRVLVRCITEDRVLVTQNARDFRKLVGGVDLHPGLIILPAGTRQATVAWLDAAIAYLEARGDPMDLMVNRVLEVEIDGRVRLYRLP